MKLVKRSLLFLCLLVAASLQAQVRLSFNPAQGDTYCYLYQVEQVGNQEVMGKNIRIGVQIDIVYEMKVKEKSAEAVSMDVAYRDILFSLSSDMANFRYDSRHPEADSSEPGRTVGAILESFLNKTFSIDLSPDGAVKSVSGFEAVMQGLIDAAPENRQLSEMARQAFSEESMKHTFEQSFKIYPASAVAVGDSWDGDISLTSFGMNAEIKNTYTLQSLDGNVASLDATSAFQFAPVAGMEGQMTGNQEGEIRLNTQTGMPIQSTMTQKIKGTFSVQGNSFSLNMDSKIKMKRQEK